MTRLAYYATYGTTVTIRASIAIEAVRSSYALLWLVVPSVAPAQRPENCQAMALFFFFFFGAQGRLCAAFPAIQ